MFTNAKQSLPQCFMEKIKADKEWLAFKAQPVMDFIEAKKKRGAVLRTRDNCQSFISKALKP